TCSRRPSRSPSCWRRRVRSLSSAAEPSSASGRRVPPGSKRLSFCPARKGGEGWPSPPSPSREGTSPSHEKSSFSHITDHRDRFSASSLCEEFGPSHNKEGTLCEGARPLYNECSPDELTIGSRGSPIRPSHNFL